ncbi:disease resistance protein L6-like [Malania oleifera]|uniref:disease resistance protein L6-like n=1 Tax=Malania oleifera TaxID=397392 RepID=UPI0025AE5269|nr:disease resistance protein L6-like [Malania oleifera]XP_057978132.1 disease resistance protein L6-like [Malania oleifera]
MFPELFWPSILLTLGVILLPLIAFHLLQKKNRTPTATPSVPDETDRISTSSAGWDYEVFLSFRGKDIRKSFTDFLYNDLVDAGIRTFRDDDELPIGEKIATELLKGIENSKISIPIFSTDYASSKWCLNEVTHMVKCKQTMGHMILPIFYDVDPSQVRHQTGCYEKAFRQHKKHFEEGLVEGWKKALREVGALKGWELKNIADGHQGKLIKMVVSKVWRELKKTSLVVTNDLVGIDYHLEETMRLLSVDLSDVRIIGIHGMGGIGKTTIAKVIYNQLSRCFDSCSFLADVRETSQQHKGLVYLQNQLISNILKRKCQDISDADEGINTIKDRLCNKKALIVLDDVDHRHQLNALAGSHDWFGSGSRIIITTRDKNILSIPEVDSTYEPKEMDFNQSLQLFSRHAFRRDYPPEDYITLSSDAVDTAAGLPLALEVIGSLLSGKKKSVWEDTLKKLKKVPEGQIQKKLRISYEALDHEQKQIFLDIACLFIGIDKRIVVYMWDDCDFFPENGIEVLLLMSLVKIGDGNELRMHDQLRDLGREIVRQENYKEPWLRSRLWSHDECFDMLVRKMGTAKVEALCLNFGFGSQGHCFTSEEFVALYNLRFLQLDHANLAGDFKRLLSQLRWLHWNGCPGNFSPTNFHLDNLVILDLSWSKITQSWEGWGHIEMTKKLKVLNLTNCIHLIRTPDFSAYAALERLILEDCGNLVHIDPSIGHLKHLVFLNMRRCTKLNNLPLEMVSMGALKELLVDGTSIQTVPVCKGHMKSLEILSATECASLTQVSCSIGRLTSLSHLTLDFTSIVKLPDSIGLLVKLQILSLTYCRQLKEIPESIGKLKSLMELHLFAATVTEIPDTVGNLRNLRVLDIDTSMVKKFPSSIGMLEKLEEIRAWHCYNLEGDIPSDLGKLSSLRILSLDCTKIRSLPVSISGLSCLQSLGLIGCKELQPLPELPSSLTSLRITCVSMETFPHLLTLINLKELCFSNCFKLVEIPSEIGKLSKLETLKFYKTNISILPANISELSRLQELAVEDSEKIQYFPELPSSLFKLCVQVCESLETLPCLSNLKNLSYLMLGGCLELTRIEGLGGLELLASLDVSECEKLSTLDGLERLGYLRELNISKCTSLERLPDLSNLKNLRKLLALHCNKLIEIQGLDQLKSLEKLKMSCISMNRLPDLSNLEMLRGMELIQCEKLQEIEGLDVLESLERLDMSQCTSLQRLPDLSNLIKLKSLQLHGCKKLTEIQGLEKLKSLTNLDISGCTSLDREKLPKDLPYIKKVKGL